MNMQLVPGRINVVPQSDNVRKHHRTTPNNPYQLLQHALSAKPQEQNIVTGSTKHRYQNRNARLGLMPCEFCAKRNSDLAAGLRMAIILDIRGAGGCT
jgi:hypothetical protein